MLPMKKTLHTATKIVVIYNNDYSDNSDSSESSSEEGPYPSGSLSDSILCYEARSSIKSVAHNVRETLQRLGYKNVKLYPVETISQIKQILSKSRCDLVFNLCETLDADSKSEISIVKCIEKLNVPFTGNNSAVLEAALNKYKCSNRLRQFGPIAPESFLIQSMKDLETFEF